MKPARSRYRTPAILCGIIVLGWAWDFALGGGAAHSLAWLGALVVVGGISMLSARAATARDLAGEPEAEPQATPAASPPRPVDPGIRPARPENFPELIRVEAAADALFTVAGYGPVPGMAEPGELESAQLVLVHGHPIDGFVRVDIVDGLAHVEQLSVRPKSMRQGTGTALLEAACDWARVKGFAAVTLCTFADVPWNGPFYAKRGFVPLTELTPGLQALRATETRLGLDDLGTRQVMRRDLAAEPVPDVR